MHIMDADKMYKEKDRWELHKNSTTYIYIYVCVCVCVKKAKRLYFFTKENTLKNI